MADSSSLRLLQELRQKRMRVSWWPVAASISPILFVLFLALGAPVWLLILVALLCGCGIAAAYLHDVLHKSAVIMYDIDSFGRPPFERLYACLMRLGQCGKVWHLNARGRVHDRKYHAGASELVRRQGISLDTHDPPYVKTNVSTPRLRLADKSMYFLPDRILVYAGNDVGVVAYHDLRINSASSRFIEDGSVPHDASVVDHTWRYVNKGGGPDRRFNNNHQLPVCMYEEMSLSSSSGLNEVLQASRCGLGYEICATIREMATMLEVAEAAERRRQSAASAEASAQRAQPQAIQVEVRLLASDVSADTLFRTLLNILCCFMVADGRASRAEKTCIFGLLGKVNAPWDEEEMGMRVREFVATIESRGYSAVLEETLAGIYVFKLAQRERLLLECVNAVIASDSRIDERVLALSERIRRMLA